MMFELRPDVFPGKHLTEVEMHLWELYLADLNEQTGHHG